MSADSETADVFDFVDAYLAALERGEDRPLTHWLERFPSSQAAIAREWLALRQPAASTTAGATPTNGAAGGDARDRIGPYRILRELGRGGQGTVFLAEDTRIARRVALKVLASRFDSISDEKRQRFKREADVIAKLEHPSLCSIHDAELTGDAPWIAMRFIEGRTLGECIVEAKERGGAEVFGLHLPPRTNVELHAVLSFFERAARALHAAHEAGVVHRDVKPGNIIVALDGRPVLLDFGLARDETSETGTLTQSGDVFGTPAYMSPEQLSLPSSELDRRADEYSLGVTLYEALTLVRPFEHDAKSALYRAIYSDPPPDPRKKNKALGEDIKVVLETALEKDRARRYASTLAFAEDLRRIREYEPIHARPASVGVKLARWTRRHPALAVAIPGIILALAIGLIVSLQLLDRTRAALSVALGRHLAQRAVVVSAEDPHAGVVLGIDGVRLTENEFTRSSLLTALDACWFMTRIGEDTVDNQKKIIVDGIAASPADDRAAVAFSDGSVEIVTLTDGQRTAFIERDAKADAALELDATGTRLLTAAADGRIRIHDSRTGAVLVERNMDATIACARFAPDGRRVIVLGDRIGALLLESSSLEPSSKLDGASTQFTSVRFSADGAQIALLEPGRAAAVFSATDGTRAFETTIGGGANDLQFSERGNTRALLVAGNDGALHVLDARDGREIGPTLRFAIPPTRVVACADGVHAVVLSQRNEEEGQVSLCNLDTGTAIQLGSKSGRRVTQAAFSPDRARLATTSHDLTVRIWEVATGRMLHAFPFHKRQNDVAWSADGERLITRALGTGFAPIWFARVRPDVFDLEGHGAAVSTVEFSRDGNTALTASADGTARVWCVDQSSAVGLGRELARFLHKRPVRAAHFSADGRIVLTCDSGAEARTWDASSGAPLRDMAIHPATVLAVALAGNGERFASLCADGRARLWQARSSAPPIELEGDLVEGAVVAFSPDDELVALSDARDSIRLYDVDTGKLRRTFAFTHGDGERAGVVTFAFRPGSDEIAAACGDQSLRWFRMNEGATARKESSVFAFKDLSFSRDGTRLLLAGAWGGGAVRSISLADGTLCFPKTSHSDDMTSACYSEDAALVLTTSKDGSARVWRSMDFLPVVRREEFGSAILCAAISNANGQARAITGCADGRVSVWPIDPLPAARARELPALNPYVMRRETELALPLEYP